ncbi:hypothetical protein [Clostridium sp. BJN0013]|uniref:hypothetical protein n=1 Tax=Clostridium sp. BJN0013 TaxID=3236840 RepID=UPI0034C64B53
MSEVENMYKKDNVSLALIRPSKVYDLVIKPTNKDWTPKQQAIINQTSLFDNDLNVLEKIPWNFSFEFRCGGSCCKNRRYKMILLENK